MGNSLGDQLLKLGLVDEKQIKRSKHDKRTRNKQKGREAVEAERAARQQQAAERRNSDRVEDRNREHAKREAFDSRELENRISQIVSAGRVTERTGGRRRFYYVARDRRVPLLEVNDDTVDSLESGAFSIAEDPTGRVTIIHRDAANRVRKLDSEWIRS